jgi:hypothetical protein
MKLGNTSQTVIPVPNFFYNQTSREIDTFNVSHRRRYFKEKDLFRMTKDMNFSNNPRKNLKKFEQLNKEKYIPIHKRNLHTKHNLSSKVRNTREDENLKTFNSDSSESKEKYDVKKHNGFKQYTDYMERTNFSKITQGDVREEIRTNIKDLLDKINTNFDIEKFKQVDIKSHSETMNSIKFTPLATINQNEENETQRFKNTLRNKIKSLTTVNSLSKEKAIKTFQKENNNNNLDSSDENHNLRSKKGSNLPVLENTRNAQTSLNLASDHKSDKYDKVSFPNMTTLTYTNFLVPYKKNLDRRREKESQSQMFKKSDYFNIIKPENYSCMNHRKIFCESYFSKPINSNLHSTYRDADGVKIFNCETRSACPDLSNVYKSFRDQKEVIFK